MSIEEILSEKAGEAYENGDFRTASNYFKILISAGVDAYDAAALACYADGNYRDALTFGGMAHKLHPEDQRINENLQYYKAKSFIDYEDGHNQDFKLMEVLVAEFVKFERVPITVIDVGVEGGKWSDLFKATGICKIIDGIEAYAPLIEINHLNEKYDHIYNMDVREYIKTPDNKKYDVAILGEILEHLTVEEAREVLDYFCDNATEVVVTVPYQYQQDAINGNEFQEHIQDDLTREIVLERYPRLVLVEDNEFHGVFLKRE